MQRIRDRIAEEENLYHRQHIAEFSAMIDERIKAIVPQMLQEQREQVQIDIQASMNGRPVNSNKDFLKGVKNAVMNVLNGKGR